jgi:hypothetical protein
MCCDTRGLLRRYPWPDLSFAKTPRQLNFINVTCYNVSLYVVDFKCAFSFDEAQGVCVPLSGGEPASVDAVSSKWERREKEMDGKELREAVNATLEAIDAALQARLARRGDMVSTDASLLSLIREARDPEAAKAFERPASPPQLPAPPPEFPKLKVKYDQTGNPVEHVVCETIFEEIPYMSGGWYTRPLSELEQIRRTSE